MNKFFALLLCVNALLMLPGCDKKNEETNEVSSEKTSVRSAITKEVIEN